MKTVLTTLTTLLLLNLCIAQNNASSLQFNFLSVKDGLSEGQVNDLLQDREGYLWIATQRGLVRYDGYKPKVYDLGIKDPYAIDISSIFEDSKGELWIGVTNGIYQYDRANDRFIPFTFIKRPLSFTEGDGGKLWLIAENASCPGNKLILLDPATKEAVSFGMEEKGRHHINATTFTTVFKDKQQRIWVGSNNGLYEYNAKEGTFTAHFAVADSFRQMSVAHIQEDAAQPGILYFTIANTHPYKPAGFGSYNTKTGSITVFHHDATDSNSTGSDSIWQVQNDSKGRLWVLTAAGISMFNPVNHTFANYPSTGFLSPVTFGFPLDFKENKQGGFWCSSANGLFYFDVQTKQFTKYSVEQNVTAGLASDGTHTLFVDRSGTLWFGAAQEGLQWVDTKHHRYKKYTDDSATRHEFKMGHTNSFAKAADGTIWLGTEHGLYHWLVQQGSFQFIKLAPYADENSGMRHVFCDSKGLVWFSTHHTVTGQNGLYCYNPATGKVISYRSRPNDITSLSNDVVNSIYEDHLGNIWIGTYGGGICRFNRQSQTFTRFPFIMNNNTLSDTHGALDDDQVFCIYEDQKGTLWVGTNNGGLNRFNRQQGTFTSYVGKSPGFTCVLSINKDSKGRLWVGTFGGGLFEISKSGDSIKRFTEKEGLLYDGVIATAEDHTGNIWVTSQRGISILHPTTGQVRTITDISNLYAYNHSIPQTNTGDFLIGTTNGFVALNPNDYAPDSLAPVVYIEEIHLTELVNNKPEDSVIVAASQPSYQFHYDENRITFRYVGLYYLDAQGTKYAYKLAGYDKDWIPAGSQRTVTYTNLAPGTYIFHVKAANRDGVWGKDKSIAFTITPPWWNTWWAYGLITAIIFTITNAFYRSRVNLIRSRHEVILKQKEAEQLRTVDEMKTRFFSNITHEFRTPLTLIIAPLEELKKGAITLDAVIKNLFIIHHNAQQLARLINQLLDLSKLEAGNMMISLSRGELQLFIADCVRSFEQLAASKQIHLHFEADAVNGDYLFDAGKLEKIILNLLSNAIKFTPPGGEVSVKLKIIPESDGKYTLFLQVSDSGIGIAADKLPKIFTRFYQVDTSSTRAYEGTGIGLALAKELTELVGGSIQVESQSGIGTTFHVVIPVQMATNQQFPVWNGSHSTPDLVHESIAVVKQPVATACTNKPLILIVEDNKELLAFIADALQTNYRILIAENGAEGLKIAQEELPDIIISDVMMPVMDGYEFCRLIKSNVKTNHIAFILLTAKAAHDSVIEGLMHSADDYITKPFHMDELQLRLRNILDHQEKIRQHHHAQLTNPKVPFDLQTEEDAFLKQLYTIIEEHIDDSSLNVEKLAKEMAVSRRTLNRKLSVLVGGLSTNDVVRQYRLKKAAELLKRGYKIADIAYRVGFETPAYFSTSFKSFYGVPPSEYMNTVVSI